MEEARKKAAGERKEKTFDTPADLDSKIFQQLQGEDRTAAKIHFGAALTPTYLKRGSNVRLPHARFKISLMRLALKEVKTQEKPNLATAIENALNNYHDLCKKHGVKPQLEEDETIEKLDFPHHDAVEKYRLELSSAENKTVKAVTKNPEFYKKVLEIIDKHASDIAKGKTPEIPGEKLELLEHEASPSWEALRKNFEESKSPVEFMIGSVFGYFLAEPTPWQEIAPNNSYFVNEIGIMFRNWGRSIANTYRRARVAVKRRQEGKIPRDFASRFVRAKGEPQLTHNEIAANLKHLESFSKFYQAILRKTSLEAKKQERKWREADAFDDVKKMPK